MCSAVKPVTALDVHQAKRGRKLTMVTAYDYFSAQLLDRAGVDMVLVGDSLGMVVLGRKDTVGVSLDEMAHHATAVVAGTARALVVVDMPFMSYEISVEQAMLSAATLVQRSGARAIKLEGGAEVVPQVKGLVQSGIAVMGHLGLTPQRAATLGGFKVQAKTAEAAKSLIDEALLLQGAGCFALVLEAVPAQVAALVTQELDIPVIGIGAGPDCDGQVLVFHDMFGINTGHVPKFVKKYAEVGLAIEQATKDFIQEVAAGTFPASAHCFSMPQEEAERLK